MFAVIYHLLPRLQARQLEKSGQTFRQFRQSPLKTDPVPVPIRRGIDGFADDIRRQRRSVQQAQAPEQRTGKGGGIHIAIPWEETFRRGLKS